LAIEMNAESTKNHSADIDKIIVQFRKAFVLLPANAPEESVAVTNLANILRLRFDAAGTVNDLDEAIALNRAGLKAYPESQSMCLIHLASNLRPRAAATHETSSLDESIQHGRSALALCPPGHEMRPRSLATLANSILEKGRATGDISQINEAIKLYRESESISGPPDLT
jgi:tetratricopeptide (TPR) repeat protein